MSKELLAQYGHKVPFSEKDKTMSAFLSLKLALLSYFSTKDLSVIEGEENINSNTEYQEKYLQTIFHFHHFFELFMKDVLRLINPILAMKINHDNGTEILKLIQGEYKIGLDTKSIEFHSALVRLKSFAGDDSKPEICRVIRKDGHFNTLKSLNFWRNTAWHDGTWIMKYSEFDIFISKQVLPLVITSIENSHYKGYERLWKYQKPLSNIDVISNFMVMSKKQKYDHKLICLNKAIGYACYNMPTYYPTEYDGTSDEMKNKITEDSWADEVRTCFLCGDFSLYLYGQDISIVDPRNGDIEYEGWEIDSVKCKTCQLDLLKAYSDKEPSLYDDSIPLIWKTRDYRIY
ncbi:hypothetical protein MK805_06285 [Shimazuella sp. AN120528]|uniref:hypothetical protein n=1 Tax=Shimazuella soli TaxID=1892854 RepID=UPI001F0F4EC7|nr:hypothetical protein [Shimazuella soli]MCH5584577.1 hypothetical protein [Shimazuella soli]